MVIGRFLHRRRLLALFAVLALLAVSCGGDGEAGPTPGQSPDGEIDQITWAVVMPDTLFVPHFWATNTGAIMSLVQEGLLAFDDNLALTEALAESWQQVDPTTYVYRIREGATFHDGSPVTAEDVAFSMAWHLEPDSASQLAGFYASVESVEATGPLEVTVKLTNPDAQFQYTPAHMAGFVFKKDQYEANPEEFGSPSVLPIGTGPFKLVEFVPNEQVVLERFDDYWGVKSPVKRIVIRSIPDTQTRLLAMGEGDIDGAFDIPISEVEQWEALDGVEIVSAPSNGVYLLTLDYETPPFDDIHVRRAIAHAIDKESLVAGVLNGHGQAADAINPPGMWTGVLAENEVQAFYDTLPKYEFSLDAARQELAQSSAPEGFEFTLQVPNTDPLMVNSALAAAESLRQIGVTMNVKEVDPGAWLDVYYNHEDLGVQFTAYLPDYADPANYPLLFLHSQNAVKDGLNASNYRNPQVDTLIDEALQSSDVAVRAASLQEAIMAAAEDVAVIPLFWPDSAMAISDRYRFDGYNAFWYNIPWAIRGFGNR